LLQDVAVDKEASVVVYYKHYLTPVPQELQELTVVVIVP
jgi:hypothetical protein